VISGIQDDYILAWARPEVCGGCGHIPTSTGDICHCLTVTDSTAKVSEVIEMKRHYHKEYLIYTKLDMFS
jgi:hypothetical protein